MTILRRNVKAVDICGRFFWFVIDNAFVFPFTTSEKINLVLVRGVKDLVLRNVVKAIDMLPCQVRIRKARVRKAEDVNLNPPLTCAVAIESIGVGYHLQRIKF